MTTVNVLWSSAITFTMLSMYGIVEGLGSNPERCTVRGLWNWLDFMAPRVRPEKYKIFVNDPILQVLPWRRFTFLVVFITWIFIYGGQERKLTSSKRTPLVSLFFLYSFFLTKYNCAKNIEHFIAASQIISLLCHFIGEIKLPKTDLKFLWK